ncbi:DMT family transporter [Lederbergia lenta]|uniref:Membrane-spanning protein n=1 Tax=Lederbergia lenta TaxID=1467 RepID=A0A2X4Z8Q1_LEDLE|nr:DMT family transporter [Lederbergia lenta]MCM3110400.1 DMT family transporter [Lederbergia lenta]MEC2324033.1 DMT family transporter [Lederbergia lenta]SQI60765.1 membrane-spanning protein [Lederbergia lenta]
MAKLIYIIISILGGMLAGIQAPVNGELGKKIGTFEGALFSFFIGTLFLTFIVLFFGKGQMSGISAVPKWQLVGGFIGAIFVMTIIIAVPHLGVALTILSAIIGQVLISMVIDHFGFFGVEVIPINWNRVIGLILMFTALFFIYRDRLTI